MARRPRPPRVSPGRQGPKPAPTNVVVTPKAPEGPAFWDTRRTAYAVVALLLLQATLAATSLIQENPTIDEVAHLPAGLSYWQKGTFRLYPHNPPLLKMIAALPVLLASPETEPIYRTASWTNASPSQANFGQLFTLLNAPRYFELFTRARLLTPLFLILGGVVVFAWSARLYGRAGGLLSLALWSFCPNVLAHGRLVTSDAGAMVLGVAATYLFWRYLKLPSWRKALVVAVVLGLAQLSKFSLLLLYGIWPLLWLFREFLANGRTGRPRRFLVGLGHGLAIVAVSVLVIDLGYGFEGVGRPLGDFHFASRGLLTRPGETLDIHGSSKHSANPLIDVSWRHRVNRFRDTPLASLPSPLPAYYLLGFDEQKIEADGVPRRWVEPDCPDPDEISGYPVYLNGVMQSHGWWYYYLATLLYKVPEGTLFLAGASLFVLLVRRRSGPEWADEVAVLAVPVVVLGAMSFLTDICLGLRYILPMFPYVFISIGKLAPWAETLRRRLRGAARIAIIAGVVATGVSTVLVHPHYLAYFNTASGGPDRGAEHLIDSNLDWGQDLVGLREWLREYAPGERVGLVYFGQINPNIFELRGDGFDWFLPPALPDSLRPMVNDPAARRGLIGPATTITPGLYAVSASVVQGLRWRFYDPAPPPSSWYPAWDAYRIDRPAYGYFRSLKPFDKVGHSIFLYRVTEDQARRLNRLWNPANP